MCKSGIDGKNIATLKFGIIGCGMMGREFASATARWCHLPKMSIRPEIVAICNRTLSPEKTGWFTKHFKTIRQVTSDYRELLQNPEIEAVYIAVPHNLHHEIYCAALAQGKHLMGEKPFGIDLKANAAIMEAVKRHPECFVRCASEFIFFPAVQRMGQMLEEEKFGTIIEVNCGFLHCSDLNPDKPINWKRRLAENGAYGCMGDLGPHVCAFPLRAGWSPLNVRAILSNIVRQRPDGKGESVACETWDNATLLCETQCPLSAEIFPMTMKIQRIAPGNKNNWYLEIIGTKAAARFSTKAANRLDILEYTGGRQAWQRIDMGHEVSYTSITPGIFQFGVSDSILQMWAAFLYEYQNQRIPAKFAGCMLPEETAIFHRLFSAALESHKNHSTVPL